MTGQNDGCFQYEAIIQANRQIRLLQFKNVPFGLENYEHKLLKCTIATVSLNSKPEYKMLSYVWGDGTRCMPIVVNGNRMNITASLENALRHLMLFQALLKQQIWIDAVCINQDDNEEKAWQVRMMKDIYLNAKSSIGWPGLPDEVSRLAFETVWESKLYVDFAFALGENAVVTDMLARVGKDIILAPTSGNMTRSNAIRLLLDRTFFSRTWIHQEVMVAKKINLVCGTEICNWDDLQLADTSGAKHMGDAGFGVKFDLMEMLELLKTSRPILGSPGPKCFQLRFYFEENPQAYNLWSLVVLTRAGGARSPNPRDAIYGVLSVAADSEKLKLVRNMILR